MRSCTEILRGNLKGVNIVSCRSEELVDSFPWLRKFEQIHGNDIDQTNIKRGDKVQVVKLECMYFITVYLWTTIGSNSMGGGGGVLINLEHMYVYYPFSAFFYNASPSDHGSCCFQAASGVRKIPTSSKVLMSCVYISQL